MIEPITSSVHCDASDVPERRPAHAGATPTNRAAVARRHWFRWSTWFVSVDDTPTAQTLSDHWSSVPHR